MTGHEESTKFDVCATYQRIIQNAEVRPLHPVTVLKVLKLTMQAITATCRHPDTDRVDSQVKW